MITIAIAPPGGKLFPRQEDQRGGWTLDVDFLDHVLKHIELQPEQADELPSLEQIEMVLLAVESSRIRLK